MLITMPWGQPSEPSLTMGTLHSVLSFQDISVLSKSYFLEFINYLSRLENHNGKKFNLADYQSIVGYYGLGEWIFGVPPFREYSDNDDLLYFNYLRSLGTVEKIINTAINMRKLVPAFLEQCVLDILKSQPDVVVFLPMYRENVPSLVLARMLKENCPNVTIVFAGPVTDGPVGTGLIKAFDWIDVIVRGDPEEVLPEVILNFLQKRSILPQAGLCYRDKSIIHVIEQSSHIRVSMRDLPIPSFDEYFDRLDQSQIKREILRVMWMSYESSRGCWWAERSKCTFCALTGSIEQFRSKDPDKILSELQTLAHKYKCLKFHIFDWIIDLHYFQSLLPKLSQTRFDFTFYMQTKSNLTKEQLKLLASVGATLQVGVESLSTPILKQIKKGTSTIQNIRTLKWCAELGIKTNWNIIYNLPNEPIAEYQRMAALAASLTHLSPPTLNRFRLHPLSPYFEEPQNYFLHITRPMQWYRYLYPNLGDDILFELAEEFEFSHLDGRQNVMAYVGPLAEVVDRWQKNSPLNYRKLSYKRGPGFLTITDDRLETGCVKYTLDEREALIYLACDDGSTLNSIQQTLVRHGYGDISTEQIIDFLNSLIVEDLVYEEGGHYLSLAIADISPLKQRVLSEGIIPLLHS